MKDSMPTRYKAMNAASSSAPASAKIVRSGMRDAGKESFGDKSRSVLTNSHGFSQGELLVLCSSTSTLCESHTATRYAVASSVRSWMMSQVAIHSELGLHGLGRSCGHSHLADTVTKREMR